MAARKVWGRRRYVGFRVAMERGAPPDRQAMVEALDAAADGAGLRRDRRLTIFSGELGIARCGHTEVAAMTEALRGIRTVDGRGARVETLVTSGTIKKVKGHLGLDRVG